MSLEPLIWSFKAAAQNCHHLAKTFSLPRNDLHDILVTSLNQWPNATLIELYIEIESNKERGINYLSNTIQQQLQQQSEIEHINLNFLYYHWIVEYLSSALMQEDKAQVRNVLFNQLCNCIKRYFDKNKMHAYTTPQHIEPLYRKLLGLPASVHTPPVLKNISLDNTRTDIYLWLNYLFLLQLINTRAFNDGLSMDDAFSQMFTAIISKSNTITSIYPWEGTLYALWRTFITWTTEHKSGNSLLKRDKEDRTHFIYSSLEQAISQLVINHEHRYNPGDVIPMAKLIPLKDWTLINGLLEQCMDLLPVLSRAKKSHLFYLLIENVYYWRMFIYSLAVAAELKEGYPLQRQFVKIEQSFINALSKFPHDQALWTMRLTFVKQLTSAVSNDSKDKDNGDDKGDDDDDDKTTEKNALLSSVINEAKRYLPMHTTTNLHCS
ncbi:hypothetical protein BDF22DRAFT_687132 [Syncephalis plumigaleata]|nr:hypothetical protein BDF22DRAFT_687132 [Syncephalis plumigaleata]